MKNCFTLFLTLFFLQFSFAQERAVVEFQPENLLRTGDGAFMDVSAGWGDIPIDNIEPFLAFSIVWQAEDKWEESALTITFSTENEKLTPIRIEPDEHAIQSSGRFISKLYFIDKAVKKFYVHYIGKPHLQTLQIHFFNPGLSNRAEVSQITAPKPAIPRSLCPCPQPGYQDRFEWCPNGNCPKDATPSPTTVTHLIIHHSAGSNVATDWAAVVRSIWDFHVNANGWDDIGYNWLIDPNGVLYEGRGDGVLGAHFCGTNGGTMGVCMLGDFTNTVPTDAAVNKLTDLLAWKTCDIGADPLGSFLHGSSGLTLKRISGHRDGVCTTSCPGNAFYPLLPDIREAVQFEIDSVCQVEMLDAPTVLAGEAVAPTQIELTWQDNSTTEEGYLLERSTNDNTSYFELAELPANTTSFTDFTVFPGMGYFYRVKAVQGNLESGYSNEIFVSTDLMAGGQKEQVNSARIFPNPAGNQATILVENQWMGMVRISIYDGLGRQVEAPFWVEKQEATLAFPVDLKHLTMGVFWVKIWVGGEIQFLQFNKLK